MPNVNGKGSSSPVKGVVRRRTRYRDKRGNPIFHGDILEGCFGAPWDEEVPITIRFRVVRDYGRLWCKGIESNHEDDYLSEMAHKLEKVECV